MGRAAALSLACADTDTSRKGDEAKEHQLGSVKIGYYEWQNSAAQRCLAGSNDEHEPEDEGDTGVVDEDLPIRACVHCSFQPKSGIYYNVPTVISSHVYDAATDAGPKAATSVMTASARVARRGQEAVATDRLAGMKGKVAICRRPLQPHHLVLLLHLPIKRGCSAICFNRTHCVSFGLLSTPQRWMAQ